MPGLRRVDDTADRGLPAPGGERVNDPLKLRIGTRAEGKPTGFDSAITGVPGRWYVTVNGKRAFLPQLAGRDLRAVSERLAANISERLHHADWTITGDPGQVTALGLMHDCKSCQAGVDQALAFLRDNPDGELAVGQLWWAAQPGRTLTENGWADDGQGKGGG
jgi:hypothetical protein